MDHSPVSSKLTSICWAESASALNTAWRAADTPLISPAAARGRNSLCAPWSGATLANGSSRTTGAAVPIRTGAGAAATLALSDNISDFGPLFREVSAAKGDMEGALAATGFKVPGRTADAPGASCWGEP